MSTWLRWGLVGIALVVGGFLLFALVIQLELQQRWQVMVQPPGVPPVPYDERIYTRRYICEAIRTAGVKTGIQFGQPPLPLVCQGKYAWWELMVRAFERADTRERKQREDDVKKEKIRQP
jgi:hypothetical protein